MSNVVQFIDSDLFGPLKEKALNSRRLRTNYNFHSGDEDNPHRFLNVMAHGTFVAPHRHLHPPKSETILILDGSVGLFFFDDDGNVTSAIVVGGSSRLGVDIPAGVWHTLVVLTPFAVAFEVKAGPYLSAQGKDFPVWTPREGDTEVPGYLERLLAHLPPGA